MNYKFLFLFLLLGFRGSYAREVTHTDTVNTFVNPVRSSGPDPWVIQKGDIYYYTFTSGDRITISATKTVSQLAEADVKTIWTPPSSGPYSHNLWAPELHYLNGRWYFYFAADDGNDRNHRMYVLENTTKDPTSDNWVFKGKISDKSDKWAIDGTVLQYNNKLFFLWSGWEGDDEPGRQQIYIAEMSDPWTIEGERVMISEPVFDWERNGLVNEGPLILKNKSGRVYLVYSGSGCWTDDYKLGMLSLKKNGNPLNPSDWVKKTTPVFVKKPENQAYGPGHNGFFKSPDGKEDWIIYHANPLSGQGCGDFRSTRIQKFNWNADGSPDLGEPLPLNHKISRPSGEVKKDTLKKCKFINKKMVPAPYN